MGRWPGMICKPSGSLSASVITAALSGSWGVGSAGMSSQLVGDAVVAAAAVGVAGAEELAWEWRNALRERGWASDEELAAELEAALERAALVSCCRTSG
jgi:hypothetical protein